MRRSRPLPRGSLRGRYRTSPKLLDDTRSALHAFAEAGHVDGGHEGICFWAGREGRMFTYLQVVLVPTARHSRFGVFVSDAAFGEVARCARAKDLGILAQVHSHPGRDTRHSDGDDRLILMPFENMLSVVAPHYGRSISSIMDFGIHQFQNHRWVLCNNDSVSTAFTQEPYHD